MNERPNVLGLITGVLLAGLLLVECGLPIVPAPTPTPEPTAIPTMIPTEIPTPGPTPVPGPTPEPSVSSLVNGSFEGGALYQDADPDRFVPLGWRAWDGCDQYSAHVEVETHPPNVLEGHAAARTWQDWRTCAMGLYQRVEVLPGAMYEFTIYGMSLSHDETGRLLVSHVWMWVGLDPEGGSDPDSPSVVWSPEDGSLGAYRLYQVRAVARGPWLTVFVRAWPVWGIARSDTFWDLANLVEISPPGGYGKIPGHDKHERAGPGYPRYRGSGAGTS